MGPGQYICKFQILVIFILACSFLAGTVSAGPCGQIFSGLVGCGSYLNCSSYPCCDSNPNVCAYGGTCGGTETVISLGMTGSRFSGTPTSGQAPLKVQFSANSGPETPSYSWDFGDGSYGSGADPVHTYTTPGTYTVKLTVRQGQEDMNYRISAYSSWGQESTWLKEEMIQVTGPVSMGELVATGENIVSSPSTGLVQAGTTIQPGLVIKYLPGMNLPVTVRQVQPLYVQAGKTSTGAPVIIPWKIGVVGYC